MVDQSTTGCRLLPGIRQSSQPSPSPCLAPLLGVDSSSQCTIALNLKTRFFYSFKTVTNGYKPITGQLTGPLVWGLWLQMVTNGYKWLQMVTNGYKFIGLLLCGDIMWEYNAVI